MWLETDPWLLGLTCLVTVLHTVFELLAFKSDISFWKGKDSMEGISVRSLYMELVLSIIIQLYLLENETSLLISLPHGFNIILTLWKIAQASKFARSDRFPYFKLIEKASYTEN